MKDLSTQIREEELRLKGLLEQSLVNLKEIMSSTYWSYTKEYYLGKLDVAKAILESELAKITELCKLWEMPR